MKKKKKKKNKKKKKKKNIPQGIWRNVHMAQEESCGSLELSLRNGVHRQLFHGAGEVPQCQELSVLHALHPYGKTLSYWVQYKSDKIDSARCHFLYRYNGTECVKPYKMPDKTMQRTEGTDE